MFTNAATDFMEAVSEILLITVRKNNWRGTGKFYLIPKYFLDDLD